MALSRARRPEYFLLSLRRLLFFSIELFFAINVSWLSGAPMSSLPERKVERAQQRSRLVVGFRAGAHGNVHPPEFGDFVVVVLGKDVVLFDPDVVVPPAVEALGRKAAKIA